MSENSMLGKWGTDGYQWAPRYSDDAEESYKLAIAFLDGPGLLEDWGCGGAWAKRFVRQAEYLGIDGTPGYCDVVADLAGYGSAADYVLLRHVLEHNWEWERILRNAMRSARERLCLVTFTPFQDETRKIADNPNGVPDIGFKKSDLLEILGACSEEEILSGTQYGRETLFRVDLAARRKLPYGLREIVVE